MNALTGYLFGGVGLLALLAGGYGLYERGSRLEAEATLIQTKASLQIALDANTQQTAAIAELKRQDQLKQQSAVDLQAAVDTVHAQSQKFEDAIAKLDKASADVRSFRSTLTPADVQCLLAHKPVGCHLN